MKNISFIFLFLLLNSTQLMAQHTKTFKINVPKNNVPSCLYKTVEVIDGTSDSLGYGYVQTGMFNRTAAVVTSSPLHEQFTAMAKQVCSGAEGEGTLTLQLRSMRFSEAMGVMGELGYCAIRANLYCKEGDRYFLLASLDTVLDQFSPVDVTDPLLNAASGFLTSLVCSNLSKRPANTDNYDLQTVLNIDSLEKQQLRLYTGTSYNEGIYNTYRSLSNQVPDMKPAKMEFSGNRLLYWDQAGNQVKLKSSETYAVVMNGDLFIATPYDFYQLVKTGDDFYFTGEIKTRPGTAQLLVGQAFFGIVGPIVMINKGVRSTFYTKLDHVNGRFIALKHIPDEPLAE